MIKKCVVLYIFVCLFNNLKAENVSKNCIDSDFHTGVCRQTNFKPPLQSQTDLFERTLILLKPDAVDRKLVGKIMERFENKGLKLVGMKMFLATKKIAADHYVEHKDREFFDDLIEYMSSRPLIPMVWEGPNSIKVTRNMLGVHDPVAAMPGTIRGDFSTNIQNNVIHGSDSVEAANREINIWFNKNEVMPLSNKND